MTSRSARLAEKWSLTRPAPLCSGQCKHASLLKRSVLNHDPDANGDGRRW
jgi:hypothetical protein